MQGILPAFLWLLLAFCQQQAFAQTLLDTTALCRVETVDGNEYTGHLLFQDSERVRMQTQSIPEINLLRPNIVRMTLKGLQAIRQGKLWFGAPQATRYFYSANSYSLKKGEGHYQNVSILFKQGRVGITDNISVGIGLVPLFLFANVATPVWIMPKISFPVVKNKLNLGAGGLFGTVLGDRGGNAKGFGLAYGLSTFGSHDTNLTLGLGYGFANGQWAGSPLLTLGGMVRIGSRSYLLSENYFVRIDDFSQFLFSIGGRQIIRKVGIDYGVFALPSEGDLFAIPWLGLTVPFGKR